MSSTQIYGKHAFSIVEEFWLLTMMQSKMNRYENSSDKIIETARSLLLIQRYVLL